MTPDWTTEAIKADRNISAAHAVLALLIALLCACFCYVTAADGRGVCAAILGFSAFVSLGVAIRHALDALEDNRRLIRIEKRKREWRRKWGFIAKL